MNPNQLSDIEDVAAWFRDRVLAHLCDCPDAEDVAREVEDVVRRKIKKGQT